MNNDAAALAQLQDVLDRLTGPDGCPWDKEQTPLTLCDYLAEETFELIDAIRRNDADEVREEMGDVLFLLVFIARLYRDSFSMGQAMHESAEKMIRRHPHVFAGQECANREQLLQTWEAVKKAEKKGKREGVYASLPNTLPPLLKAYRIHAKAARAGFTWDSDDDVEQQVEAEWLEWLAASAGGDPAEMERELGDLIFTITELGRRKGLKANGALHLATQRFLTRFRHMEKAAEARGLDFAALDMEEKNRLWDEAKESEKNDGPPKASP